MDELIRRSDAMAFQNEVEPIFCKSPITGDVFSASKDGDLVAYFDSIPAVDAVEVVRCRECRYFCEGENESESWEWCDAWKKDCWKDCFCAMGQRREDGDGE